MAILIVDHDLLMMKLTAFVLQEAGYHVLKAYDGPGTLAAVRQHDPDLVLLDTDLPKANGFDLCRHIRRITDVPVIFLSSHAQLEDRVKGLQIGADDYIVKPFEPTELLVRIGAVLRRRNSDLLTPWSRLTQGDLTLDPVEHTVVLSEERAVALTPIEFRLLYYLMQNAGQILNKDQILDKVWGYDSTTECNLVAAYIRRLRNKIEPDVKDPHYIVTVPHLGYRFEIRNTPSQERDKATIAQAG